jgi:hypothetical protein
MKKIFNCCILFCMISMFMLTTACEKSADQSQVSVVDQNGQVTTRSEECENCEFASCCCCGIEMVSEEFFTLKICGLCEGDYLCGPFSPPSPCSSVFGSGSDFIFNYPTKARHFFCVAPGSSIRIENTSMNAVTFEFTCQADITPTPIIVTLQPMYVRYFLNDGSCIVDDCL